MYRGDNNLPLKYISLESAGACIRAHWTKAPTSANVLLAIPIAHEHRWVANIKENIHFHSDLNNPKKLPLKSGESKSYIVSIRSDKKKAVLYQHFTVIIQVSTGFTGRFLSL